MKKIATGLPKFAITLKKSFFTIGSSAKDKDDYVIYNNKTGAIYYDYDGSGAGKAVQLASLSKKLKMTRRISWCSSAASLIPLDRTRGSGYLIAL